MYRVRDFTEERSRTLYVRLPHTIRNTKEVHALFEGDAKVKLPRQSSRSCHVIFPTVEEKIKALKHVKKKTVDGKRVIAFNPKTKPMENKPSRKKIKVPQPKPPLIPEITQTLFVSNINAKTKVEDLKIAFPGCTSVGMLALNSSGLRSAFVKMDSLESARQYLKKQKDWPLVHGNTLFLRADNRASKTGKRGTRGKKLSIHDKDGKQNENKFENLDQTNKSNNKLKQNIKPELNSVSESE
ncbi:uncharacterized protein [Neodiprion pinetum]|uniref:Uncharacterized protein LOC107225871 n=1 Tax=Neodiprion lecontei TaxID=441921 RepID=A0A6J0C5V0_NEOLC|nr:uncharacterized protein LOC107225871 [Neodiprion lecontei]XP_046413466.1 uncharacterized protein LOC124176343 [Neodiprion fabricii]XP_046413467.1 uncharacterized protein LOC124176343 [Neodiprion fabricii]XP_046469224.1 uncharacterized protein LOC124212804 [Neodiprion pinetum]